MTFRGMILWNSIMVRNVLVELLIAIGYNLTEAETIVNVHRFGRNDMDILIQIVVVMYNHHFNGKKCVRIEEVDWNRNTREEELWDMTSWREVRVINIIG